MPEVIKLKDIGGGLFECEPVVTKDEWVGILNAMINDGHKKLVENILLFYRHSGHRATCQEIGKEYSIPFETIRNLVTTFNRYVMHSIGNRVQIEDAESSENKLWPISMLGRVVGKDRFEWIVRPELCSAIRQFLLQNMINKYREIILTYGLDNPSSEELYKWRTLTECAGKETKDIIPILLKSNLVDQQYAGATLNEVLKKKPENIYRIFDILREDGEFDELFKKFKAEAKSVTPAGKTSFGSERTAATFLSAVNPQMYSPYTSTLYEDYCKYIGEERHASGNKYSHFLTLLDELIAIETQDSELINKIKEETAGMIYSDKLNAQDILWQTNCYCKEEIKKNWLQEKYEECLVKDKMFKEGGWFSGYEVSVNKFRTAILESQTADECIEIVDDFILKSSNGIAGLGQGNFYTSEHTAVKGAWKVLFPVLKQCLESEEISDEAVKNVNDIFSSINTERRHPIAINRIWSGLFPNLISTTADANKFYNVYNYLFKNLGLAKATGNWIKDNIGLIKFLNKRVSFQHPWHSSLFVWYLTYCINRKENTSNMEIYKSLLESNKNLILTGAPGTGKTYLAKQIAKAMGATEENGRVKMIQFHPSYDYTDFVEGLRPKVEGDGFERVDGVFKSFCARAISSVAAYNFDEAYSKLYNDILTRNEPLSLKTPNGGTYAVSANKNWGLNLHTGIGLSQNGSLSKANIEAQLGQDNLFKFWQGYYKGVEKLLVDKYGLILNNKKNQEPYVFIIDEINRGEMSKIFGELFFSIDPGYRGTSGRVDTQYQNMVEAGNIFEKGFFVPDNVYIIGTMNDIDRSVESMDFAVRRRFAWYEVTASSRSSMLDEEIPNLADQAKKSMDTLNAAIEKIGLSSAYHIGPAYYLKLERYVGSVKDQFESIWDYHIKGVLLEYLRGTRGIEDKIKDLKKAFDNYNG